MALISRKRKVELDAPLNAQKVGTSFENNPQIAPHTTPIPTVPAENAMNTPTKAMWPSPKVSNRGTGQM